MYPVHYPNRHSFRVRALVLWLGNRLLSRATIVTIVACMRCIQHEMIHDSRRVSLRQLFILLGTISENLLMVASASLAARRRSSTSTYR